MYRNKNFWRKSANEVVVLIVDRAAFFKFFKRKNVRVFAHAVLLVIRARVRARSRYLHRARIQGGDGGDSQGSPLPRI